MKYSTIEGVLTWSCGTLVMRKGMSFSDDHPLVAERPDLFTSEQPAAEVTASRVQTGMQRPGEVRMERRTAPPRGSNA